MTESPLWRVFPWDPGAGDGDRFSPAFVPGSAGRGRFDLPPRLSPVLYLAETSEHAVAEVLHPWRGRPIDARHLVRAGRRLAAVEVHVDAPPLADLCEPDVLVLLGIGPDRIASRHRAVTRPIASSVWDAGYAGLRWWSRFWGDWHTSVIFTRAPVGKDRSSVKLEFGEPQPLSVEAPPVVEAARLLGMELRG